MVLPLAERSEKARLIATAKIVQQRFDTYLANPCLPQLLSVMASLPQSGVNQDNKVVDEQAKERDKPPASPWACGFNNVGVIENRLRTCHGALVVQQINLSVRHKYYMCDTSSCPFVGVDSYISLFFQDHAHVDDPFKVVLSNFGGWRTLVPLAVFLFHCLNSHTNVSWC